MDIRIPMICGMLFSLCQTLAEPVVVNTEILTIALAEPVDGLFFHNGQTIVPFVANLSGLSQPQKYRGTQRLVIRSDESDFEGKQPPLPPVSSVLLPPNSNRVLLVCVKQANQPLKIRAYDVSSKDRAGDYRLFNFSDQILSLKMGDQRFYVEPGKDFLATQNSWRSGVMDLPIQIASVEENQPKLVYSSVWGHRPGRRSFVFMFNGRHPSRPITCCRFFDIPPDVVTTP